MWEMRTSRQAAEQGGFTLLEVLVSITILTIGLMASALLMSNTYRFTVRSRFMAEAAQLASEKLEDLNRFPQIDAHITVPTGATT
jgi:type IV pilus modification protein PilV